MAYKPKLLEFIQALFDYFEQMSNYVIQMRLLLMRHYVANLRTDEELDNELMPYLKEYGDHIDNKDFNALLLVKCKFQSDFQLIWDSLTSSTKNVIWKWLSILKTEMEK